MPRKLWVLLLALALLWVKPSEAQTMPWIENSDPTRPTHLYVLEDAHVDMALRIALIRSAKRSIRLAVYQQTADTEVGLPILHALREQAMRGVRIQVVTAAVPSLLYDRKNLLVKMLTDPTLTRPARVFQFGGLPSRRKGWNIWDSVHEKILLIDDEVAIVGGRNHGADYLKWLDFAALIVDRKPTGLVFQVRRAFEGLWFDMAAYAQPVEPIASSTMELPAPDRNTEVKLNDSQRKAFNAIQDWLSKVRAGELPALSEHPQEFRPARVRLIAHRLFDKITKGDYSGERRLLVPDPVVEELARVAQNSSQIRMSTLFVMFHPKLRNALLETLERGALVRIHVNDKNASGELVPLALQYKDNLGPIVELLRAQAEVAVLRQGPYRFVHRKIFILDEHVFFGSHNFNLPSTIANSELAIQVQDARFSEAMTSAYDNDFLFSGRPLTLEEALKDFDSTSYERWLAKFFRGFY